MIKVFGLITLWWVLSTSIVSAQTDTLHFSEDSINAQLDTTSMHFNDDENDGVEGSYSEKFDPNKYYSKDYAATKINVRTFDTTEWLKLTEKLKYKEKKPEKPAQYKKYEPFDFSNFFKAVARAILWLIIMSGFGVLIWVIYNKGGFGNIFSKNKNLDNKEQTVDYNRIDEEEITNNDFPTLIKAAESDGNYVMAIRLNYLYALKTLEEAEKIRWKKDKTNGMYLLELSGERALQTEFKSLTRSFEFYFYGKFPLPETSYRTVSEEFKKFIAQVSRFIIEMPGSPTL